MLAKLDLPMVCVGTQIGDSPTVLIDVTARPGPPSHLLSLGHREIAYVGTPVGSIAHMTTPRSAGRGIPRDAGARECPGARGLGAGRGLDRRRGDGGGRATIAQRPAPTAVLAASDEMAIRALGAAAIRARACPKTCR